MLPPQALLSAPRFSRRLRSTSQAEPDAQRVNGRRYPRNFLNPPAAATTARSRHRNAQINSIGRGGGLQGRGPRVSSTRRQPGLATSAVAEVAVRNPTHTERQQWQHDRIGNLRGPETRTRRYGDRSGLNQRDAQDRAVERKVIRGDRPGTKCSTLPAATVWEWSSPRRPW